MSKAKVTLYLDRQLWKEFRAACVRRDTSASAVVELAVQDRMLGWTAEEERERAKTSESPADDTPRQ